MTAIESIKMYFHNPLPEPSVEKQTRTLSHA